jgi:hypothetical protein
VTLASGEEPHRDWAISTLPLPTLDFSVARRPLASRLTIVSLEYQASYVLFLLAQAAL